MDLLSSMAGPGRAARGSAAHSMPAGPRPDRRGDAAKLTAPLRGTGARGREGGGRCVRGKGRRAHAQCGAGAGGGRETTRRNPLRGPHPAHAAHAPRPPGPPGRLRTAPVRSGPDGSGPVPPCRSGGQADLHGGAAAQVGAPGWPVLSLPIPAPALPSHSRSDSGERELVNTLTSGRGRTVLLVAGAAQSAASGLSSWAAVVKSAAARGFCSLTHLGLLCVQPLAFLKVLHWME